ncbi:hypothetical protein ACVI1J_006493 [Bradyrhizobium diazoefficiens]|uniref:Uncharacterized protein n=1 Tax=Bradyrhizobium barranii subsp. barranii TaxID=2823807 RepID=A0A7Z0Q4T6_9BRAD|nr:MULTISPECIES: hypothetical protein [Bradyrhizobium]MCP1790909.1 hypothetical protein [Bradyrhizobium japonicum]MCP1880017.1 hypothetical protein [Bradyrhizobium japonicum]MCP1934679.1 hypothetical protein [Bradyrhizobium japonicum]MCP1947968.1 hypothetical protein [Bradyrhizobium japonicum]MCS3544499.1 hypothetical protein [Bradyrhizobium japonicum]
MIKKFFTDAFESTAISDFLWAAATSEIALSALSVLIVVAAIVGYLPIVSTLLGGYAKTAKLVFILALTALVFLLGFRTADHRAEAKILRDQIAARDDVIARQKSSLDMALDAAETASKQRDEAAQRALEAQDEIDDYEKRLKARPNAACLLTPDDFPVGVQDHGKR